VQISKAILAVLTLLASSPLAGSSPAPLGISLAQAAVRQVGVTTVYDPTYVRIGFPNGDVPPERGVCADVVVRAFRRVGIDLQAEVHADMVKNFGVYPRSWGLSRSDSNIDHRRVPNLMKYFERRGKKLPLNGTYQPGDVVAWMLPGGLYHIGVVAEDRVPGTGRLYMIHNIGAGARKEDVLQAFEIIGHYRW
jgi:uncharacterized protein YijF (DUF1287 family)